MRKKTVYFALLALFLVTVSCVFIFKDNYAVFLELGPEASPSPSVRVISSPSPSPAPTPVPTPDLTGLAVNPLTGLYIDEAAAANRPMAVVINNLRKALPQSGLRQADVFYEVLAEAGITRIIAVFSDFDSAKIGPVRSARHYFLDFALNHDALFVHHGGSPQAYSAIPSLKVSNLDGMRLEGTSFYRDKERMAQSGMYEHSSYTSAEGLRSSAEKLGYRYQKLEDFAYGFQFFAVSAGPVNGIPSAKLTVPFSSGQQSIFEYDAETMLYRRFQGEDEHIDEETGEQLAVSNVIVQLTDMHIIAGDDAGRREVGLVGEGEGYLATGGVYVPIKWSKASHNAPTVYSYADGAPVTLNKGKTWICVLQSSEEPVFEAVST